MAARGLAVITGASDQVFSFLDDGTAKMKVKGDGANLASRPAMVSGSIVISNNADGTLVSKKLRHPEMATLIGVSSSNSTLQTELDSRNGMSHALTWVYEQASSNANLNVGTAETAAWQSINLSTEALGLSGSTGITTTLGTNKVTFSLDADLVALADCQANAAAALADLTQAEVLTIDGATAGTAVASKAVVLDGSKNIATLGTVGCGAITSTGTSTFAGGITPAADDGAALGAAAKNWSDLYLADAAVINLGDNQDVTLTHVHDTGLLLNSSRKLQFGDAGTFIHQSADGVLTIESDTTVDINGAVVMNGALTGLTSLNVAGTITGATSLTIGSAALTEAELEKLDGITNGTAAANKALVADGNVDITGLRNLTATGAVTGDSLVVTEGATFGGGYGSTGATISTAGVIQANGAITAGGNVTAVGSFVIGSADMSEADLEKLDGITNGTAAASKAVVLDASKDITGINDLTAAKIVTTGNLHVGGNLVVSGSTTVINSTVTTIDDPIMTLGGDTAPGSDDNKDRGIEFRYYDSQARLGFFGYDDSLGVLTGYTAATNTSEVFSGTAMGALFGATTVASLTNTAGATFGGGYGSTGATISTAGVGQFNGALTTDGALTGDSLVITEGATFGGGYGSTGVTISTAGVVQANGAITSGGAITAGGNVTAVGSFIIGSADLNEADLEKLDGITNGTAAANKAVVLDGSKNIGTIGTVACGAITSSGNSSMAQLTTSGRVIVDDTTDATDTTDGSLQTDGGLSVAKDAVIGDDLMLLSDAAVVHFGASKEVTLTHVADKGLTLTHTGTGDNLPVVFQLKSEEDVVETGEVIASMEFAAGDSDGTDGATVAAGIHAIAEENFAADANATKLVFTTADSETAAASATAKMTLASTGNLTTAGSVTAVGSFIIGSADMSEADLEKLDGITNGTAAANKALVADGNVDITGLRNVTGTGAVTAGTSFIIGSADLNETDLEKLDGITDGTAAANKAVVLDGSKNIGTIGTVACGAITSTGASSFGATTLASLVNTAGATFGGGYGSTGATISTAGVGTFNGALTTDGVLTGDSLVVTEGATFGGGYGSTGVTISTAGVVQANGAITSGGAITAGGNVTAVGSFIIGSADLNEADLEKLDGITNGTAAANKALVADGNVDITGLRNLTSTGNVTVGGNLTVNGTTTTVNSTTVTIDDPIFTLGGDTAPGSDDNKDRGIEFRYHDGSSARVGFFGYDDSAGLFTGFTAATNNTEVFSGTAMNASFGTTKVTKLEIDGTGDYIDVSTDLTLVSAADIKLDPTGGDVQIDGNILPTTNSDLGSASYLLGDVYINDDKKLKFGASADFTIEYDEDSQDVAQFAGANMRLGHGAATELQFRDSGLKIYSSADGQLDIDSDGELELAATTILDMDGATVNLNSSGATTVTSGTNMILQSTAGNVTVLATGTDDKVVIKGDHESGVAVHIDGDANAASIVDIDAGELDIDASAGINITSAEAQPDSVVLHANNAAGGIDLTVNSNVMLSFDANSADFGASAAAVTFASTAAATGDDTGAIQTQGGIYAKESIYLSGSTSRIATLGSMYGSNTTYADGAFANENQVVHIGGALGLYNVDGGTLNGKAALEGLSNQTNLDAGTYNGRIIYLRRAYTRSGTSAIHYKAADNFDTANNFYFCENGEWHSSVFAAAEE